MPPLVSVIIPAYESECYLDRCLQSLARQTYHRLEAIVIDDGSKDRTPRIADEFAERRPLENVLVIHQENRGAAASRNKGIDIAHGELLFFLDADDYLDDDCIETYVRAQQKYGCDVVCGGYRRPDAEGVVRGEVRIEPESEWACYSMTAGCAKLYRTEYVRSRGFRFLEGVAFGEDLFFTIPALSAASSVKTMPYVGYDYYLNEASASSNVTSSAGQEFDRLISLILDEEVRAGVEVEGILLHVFVRMAAWYLFYTSRGDSGEEVRKNYEAFVNLLNQRLPTWRSDCFARLGHPTGDALKSKVATWLFVRHPHLFLMALKAYGRH